MEWVPQAIKRGHRPRLRRREAPLLIDADARSPARVDQQPDRQRGPLQPAGRARHGAAARRAEAGSAGCRSATTGRASPSKSASASSNDSTGCWARHADGSGLGLAIVSEIATPARRAHHAGGRPATASATPSACSSRQRERRHRPWRVSLATACATSADSWAAERRQRATYSRLHRTRPGSRRSSRKTHVLSRPLPSSGSPCRRSS